MVFGLRVAGKVVDEAGSPVAFAEVQGRDREGRGTFESCKTDRDGAFELSGFQPTKALTLEAGKGVGDRSDMTHASDLFGPVEIGPDEGLTDVVLVLRPTGTFSGRVVDVQGNPRVNVSVGVFTFGEPRRLLVRSGDRTDEEGHFEVTGIPAGRWKAELRLPGTQATLFDINQRSKLLPEFLNCSHQSALRMSITSRALRSR